MMNQKCRGISPVQFCAPQILQLSNCGIFCAIPGHPCNSAQRRSTLNFQKLVWYSNYETEYTVHIVWYQPSIKAKRGTDPPVHHRKACQCHVLCCQGVKNAGFYKRAGTWRCIKGATESSSGGTWGGGRVKHTDCLTVQIQVQVCF